ncbi:hypothetical protein LZ554_003059 [Drepanopeziza brunnea f. sp. 'monogermtubi']|nr:hypothetical protein LZ554_003059 [Drepanopeziza brunnea f. sp. 'monogermtubi']
MLVEQRNYGTPPIRKLCIPSPPRELSTPVSLSSIGFTMPFRSSKIQSRIMESAEPADSRPSLDITFLNLPSPFHGSYSPKSPTSSSSFSAPSSATSSTKTTNKKPPHQTTQKSYFQLQIQDPAQPQPQTSTENFPGSSKPWWSPIPRSPGTPKAKLSQRRRLDAIHTDDAETEDGLLAGMRFHEAGSGLMENHVLEKRLRRRLLIEVVALFTLLVFLLGVVVLCVRSGVGMQMDDGRMGQGVVVPVVEGTGGVQGVNVVHGNGAGH